jgi:hypothetical protein
MARRKPRRPKKNADTPSEGILFQENLFHAERKVAAPETAPIIIANIARMLEKRDGKAALSPNCNGIDLAIATLDIVGVPVAVNTPVNCVDVPPIDNGAVRFVVIGCPGNPAATVVVGRTIEAGSS